LQNLQRDKIAIFFPLLTHPDSAVAGMSATLPPPGKRWGNHHRRSRHGWRRAQRLPRISDVRTTASERGVPTSSANPPYVSDAGYHWPPPAFLAEHLEGLTKGDEVRLVQRPADALPLGTELPKSRATPSGCGTRWPQDLRKLTAAASPIAPRRSGMRPPQETARERRPPARRREEPPVRQTNGGDASRLRPASLGRLVGAAGGTGARGGNLISMAILQIGPRFQLKFIVSS
jgi:hypothetical protein